MFGEIVLGGEGAEVSEDAMTSEVSEERELKKKQGTRSREF